MAPGKPFFQLHRLAVVVLVSAVGFELQHFLIEQVRPIEHAVLAGHDAYLKQSDDLDATTTVVVGVTSEDVARVFGGRRPLPPATLLAVVDSLRTLNPAVLVVDAHEPAPDAMERRSFYRPTGRGAEAAVRDRLERWSELRARKGGGGG